MKKLENLQTLGVPLSNPLPLAAGGFNLASELLSIAKKASRKSLTPLDFCGRPSAHI